MVLSQFEVKISHLETCAILSCTWFKSWTIVSLCFLLFWRLKNVNATVLAQIVCAHAQTALDLASQVMVSGCSYTVLLLFHRLIVYQI